MIRPDVWRGNSVWQWKMSALTWTQHFPHRDVLLLLLLLLLSQ
jgi:hypothetical protein